MTTPELPPLRRVKVGDSYEVYPAPSGEYCWTADVEARERILMARIAELKGVITDLLESEPEHCPCGNDGCEIMIAPWKRARKAIDAARGKE